MRNFVSFIIITSLMLVSKQSLAQNPIDWDESLNFIYRPLVPLEGEVKRGQGLYQAMNSISIGNAEALGLINALRDEVEFSKLKVGDKLKATYDRHQNLVRFEFSQNPVETHILVKDEVSGKWDYQFQEKETIWRARILEGELRDNSTLQEDLLAQNLPPTAVNEIINILLCKVNFRMNARKGDKYKILLNERKFEDEVIQTKILYTSYSGDRAGKHETFYYEDEEKSSTFTSHYTEDGEVLVRSGLRYPLSSLHVRSGYGWRRHPVTGRKAMHRGVDLRGRQGQPVHAVARGKVVMSTYNEYAGNKVAIRHGDGSVSFYYHLHNRRVNKGDWVESYQIIGTVGATGRVTGPHLHFGFKEANRRWINPLNKRMIATPKLSGERFVKLTSQVTEIKNLIADLKVSSVARYIAANHPNPAKSLLPLTEVQQKQ